MTDMVEVKVSELIGPALDWAVGLAVAGKPIACTGSVPRWKFTMLEASVWPGDIELGDIERYQPSTVWGDGGPLLEKHCIEISIGDEEYWANRTCTSRYDDEPRRYAGDTMLIAACRAIVAAKFGDTVSVPKELMP